MVAINARVDGLDRLNAKFDRLSEKIGVGAAGAVDAETEAVAEDMRVGAPRDTGELIDSIQTNVDRLRGVAAATAAHAHWVEFGTSTRPPQPFALPAAEISRGRFPRRLADAIDDETSELTR